MENDLITSKDVENILQDARIKHILRQIKNNYDYDFEYSITQYGILRFIFTHEIRHETTPEGWVDQQAIFEVNINSANNFDDYLMKNRTVTAYGNSNLSIKCYLIERFFKFLHRFCRCANVIILNSIKEAK